MGVHSRQVPERVAQLTCPSGIYAIINKVNGKLYVGSAIDLKNRWAVHRRALRGNFHHSPRLQNAWNKYGEEAFEFHVLLHVEVKEELISTEQSFFGLLNPFYNIAKIAGSNLGVKASEETRRKMSLAHSGPRNHFYRVTGSAHPNYGKKQTEELKKALSEKHSGAGNPMHGVTPPHAKLDEYDVRLIRRLIAEGAPMTAIAKAFGVSTGAISHIKHGRSYLNVKEA